MVEAAHRGALPNAPSAVAHDQAVQRQRQCQAHVALPCLVMMTLDFPELDWRLIGCLLLVVLCALRAEHLLAGLVWFGPIRLLSSGSRRAQAERMTGQQRLRRRSDQIDPTADRHLNLSHGRGRGRSPERVG